MTSQSETTPMSLSLASLPFILQSYFFPDCLLNSMGWSTQLNNITPKGKLGMWCSILWGKHKYGITQPAQLCRGCPLFWVGAILRWAVMQFENSYWILKIYFHKSYKIELCKIFLNEGITKETLYLVWEGCEDEGHMLKSPRTYKISMFIKKERWI